MTPQETRQALVIAGLKLFGLKGFEATKTRELADKAGVNQAAIPYHFGGKEGLYLAVAEHIVQRGRENMSAEIKALGIEVEQGVSNPLKARELLLRFYHAFVDNVVTSEDVADRAAFLMREYTDPGAGFDIIYNGLLEHVHKMQCSLVAAATGQPIESKAVILKAHAFFGTVVINVMGRNILFRRLGVDGYTPELIEEIKLTITEIVSQGLAVSHSAEMVEAP